MNFNASIPSTSRLLDSGKDVKTRTDFKRTMDNTPVLKNKKGEVISKRQKRIIINLCKDAVQSDQSSNLATSRHKIAEKLCHSTGIGKRKIMEIISEYCTYGTVISPNRTKTNTKNAFQKMDNVTCEAIRKKVHQFFLRKELPTLDKLIREIKEDEKLPNFSRTTLSRVLKDLNFYSSRRNRKSVLIDRDDIICWRRKYLREIRKYRAERRKIFFLGETLFKMSHRQSQSQPKPDSGMEDKVDGQAADGQNSAIPNEGLIALHIGNENGFLNEGGLVFESNKSKDTLDFMNYEVFESWFQQIVCELPPHSVIVVDAAPYHSRKFQEIPNSNSKKSEILNWLLEKSVNIPVEAVRAELLFLVDQHKSEVETYIVDEMAADQGHVVLRLPPYHNELNPIERIWENMRQFIASNDDLFTFENMKKLLAEAISQVTPDVWSECIRYVMKTVETEFWTLDNIVDDMVEPGVIPSSDSESDE